MVSSASPSKKGAKKTASRSSKSALHPTYNEMILKAIAALKERNGASRQKVASYIVSNYSGLGEPSSITAPLRRALVKALAAGTIVNTKGTGASGRFKLANVPKPTVVKKSVAAKKKKTTVAKPKASVAAKKSTTAKTAPKKSPAKRKAKSKAVKKTAKSPKKVKPVAKGKSPAKSKAASKKSKTPVKKTSKAASKK